jgi:putative oxidoreductase
LAGRYAPEILSILRIVTTLLLLQHAFSKFFGFPAAMPTPIPLSLIWFAGIELVGGGLVLIGFIYALRRFRPLRRARLRLFHHPCAQGFYPLTNGGESAVLFCFIFLYLAAAGGGAWSLDTARGERTA